MVFHPSYNTYNNAKLWSKEKEGLEKIINQKVTRGRQHYLRFDTTKTWPIWNNNDMIEDSSIGYSDNVGFRSGTCYKYHPFNFITKKKLNIVESPLILMEGALINGLKVTPEEFLLISNQLKEEIKKYNGVYTILWHNSSFFIDDYDKYKETLSQL